MWQASADTASAIATIESFANRRIGKGFTIIEQMGSASRLASVGNLLALSLIENRLAIPGKTRASRDAASGAAARRPNGGRRGGRDSRRVPVHRVEGASPRLLPRDARVRLHAVGGRRDSIAARHSARPRLQPLLCRSDGDT